MIRSLDLRQSPVLNLFRILRMRLRVHANFGQINLMRSLSVCMLLVATNTAGAIEIEQIRWGFNGLILPRHFNLLSILVSNPTPNEIEGTLTLKKLAGGYRAVDAVVKQQYFMSPYASKWIQLYPYCVWDTEEWILSWGPNPNEQTALPQVRSGKPATVILDEPDDSQQTGGRLRKTTGQLVSSNRDSHREPRHGIPGPRLLDGVRPGEGHFSTGYVKAVKSACYIKPMGRFRSFRRSCQF